MGNRSLEFLEKKYERAKEILVELAKQKPTKTEAFKFLNKKLKEEFNEGVNYATYLRLLKELVEEGKIKIKRAKFRRTEYLVTNNKKKKKKKNYIKSTRD